MTVVIPAPGPLHGPSLPEPGEPGWTIWPRRIWPAEPIAAAPAKVVAAAAAAALAGTLVWRVSVFSIGYLLAGLLVFGAVYGTAGRMPTRAERGGIALTLTLLTVPAVLAAEWVNTLCVASAWMVGWCTLVGGTGWGSVLVGPLLPWVLTARVAGWTRRSMRDIAVPGGRRDLWRILLVLAVTAGLLTVFGLLFAGADAAFAHLIDALTPRLDGPDLAGRAGVFAVVAAFVLFGAYLLRFPPRLGRLTWSPRSAVARWEWAVPLAALDLLVAAFLTVHLSVLFGGHRHVLDTAGLTYAEYARQGFWQLLAVSALTLLVIAATVTVAGRSTPADRRLLRILIGTLCALSVVIVGSAVHRMWLYQQAYGFTELRLLVITVEFWLAAAFVLVCVAGVRMSGRWLPHAVLHAGALAVLGLALINPDRFIAEHNIDRAARTGQLDTAYLGQLSPDALPAVAALPEPTRRCVQAEIGAVGIEPWYQFNLSRHRAQHQAPADRAGCPTRTR
ncbi:DUF4173 domain-containing protein [Mycobacterium sp. 1274756.6]|uniref:DUF4153 domain-containing protein n=1 Tax=Mycobacterium sp. 1274756.6 TaxID=1834076 RepID=UPI000AB94709|nr:DUF4173 domain-containing protein [Mycobacterium sp. 1274756.6]